MQSRTAPVARFSTDDVAPRDRLAVWRELVFQSALKVEIAMETDTPFHATAVVRQLPGLRALSGFSPPATYERSTADMEVDEVAFQFGISEGVTARFSSREAAIGSGDAFLLPCGDRASIRVQQSSQFHHAAPAARRDRGSGGQPRRGLLPKHRWQHAGVVAAQALSQFDR